MSTVTDTINRITAARERLEAALDALERAGDADTCPDADQAISAAAEAERNAFRALAEARAIDAREVIAKCMMLIDATTGGNLGEAIWEGDLPALRASIERDIAAMSPV